MEHLEIRHRRLYAFFYSKALNVLMLIVLANLLTSVYAGTQSMLLFSVICSYTALLCFIGYSVWLWGKKPANITISPWLSDVTGLFSVYFVMMLAFKPANPWWFIAPAAIAVAALFVALTGYRDRQFTI